MSLIEGKRVFLGTHWDADGITSAAIIYHLINDRAKSIRTLSKGDVFLIEKKDVPEDCDIVICTDIHASKDIDKPLIYIDHHPIENGDYKQDYELMIHDKECQSCTMVIWNNLIKGTDDPYFIFLTLLGFFGDGGSNNEIPPELELKAIGAFPELMIRKQSYYGDGEYLVLEKYVSSLNVGKRVHWSGQVPLELFKAIDTWEPFVYNKHPLAQELQSLRYELRDLYKMPVNIKNLPHLDYIQIDCDKNIQGVLCAKHMKDKPIIVMNRYNDTIMGSMRVPDSIDFDAGLYLEAFNEKVPGFVGGGHERAGGFTLPVEHFELFLGFLKEHHKVVKNI
ncbi:hypothetical protein KY340_02515 [Candidatus Woesearchaeota archaeon]|nr:hypothetical protein [Candidatus Woesearchaeota archaeon]